MQHSITNTSFNGDYDKPNYFMYIATENKFTYHPRKLGFPW